jgi:hypothetical protein
MIPVTGVIAGAGKAGLTQSSATNPAALECRKVLLWKEVTTIHVAVSTLVPRSQAGLEFAGGTHRSIVTSGLIWMKWDLCGTLDFASSRADFVRLSAFRIGVRAG